jgi:hypothetical protein
MYDGRVGRWMTTDPYSQYHSPYLAMGNDPINLVDPDGGFTASPLDDYYRNVAGDIIAIVRNNVSTVDNFYTVSDGAGGQDNVRLDETRDKTLNGWDRLTDFQKNYVVNRVDRFNTSYVKKDGPQRLNGDAVTEAQMDQLVKSGAIPPLVAGAGRTFSNGGILGVYGSFNGVPIIVTRSFTVDPGGAVGVTPVGPTPLPTPQAGVVWNGVLNMLPRNLRAGNTQITDNMGNNLLGDSNLRGKGVYRKIWDY